MRSLEQGSEGVNHLAFMAGSKLRPQWRKVGTSFQSLEITRGHCVLPHHRCSKRDSPMRLSNLQFFFFINRTYLPNGLKIFSILVKNSPSYSNVKFEKTDYPGNYTSERSTRRGSRPVGGGVSDPREISKSSISRRILNQNRKYFYPLFSGPGRFETSNVEKI